MVLATDEFFTKGREIIIRTILDHSKECRNKGNKEREEYVKKRRPEEYEQELALKDKEEGIFHSHFFNIILTLINTTCGP